MTQQIISVGSAANDGTGDPLRTAFIKSNGNFTELYARPAASPAVAIPLTDATPGVVGTSTNYAREDHVHPSDPSRVAKAGDTMTGNLSFNAPGVTVSDQGAAGNYFLLSSTNNPVFVRSTAQYVGINDTGGNVVLNSNSASYNTAVQSTQASTSPTTGALTVAGGLGVGGAIFAATGVVTNGALSLTTGGFTPWVEDNLSGNFRIYQGATVGLEIANSSHEVNVSATTASSSPTTGALTVAGGIGCSGNIYAGGGVEAFNVNINPSSGDPLLKFFRAGALQSFIQDNGGSINVVSNNAGTAGMYIAHGASAWTALSDARLPYKRTARPLSALDKLEHIQLYENEVEGRLELFGKAQELFQAFPHVVAKGDDDPDFTPTGMFDGKVWGVSYERLGLVALQAVKELLAQVKLLEDRIAALEAAK